MKLYNTLTKTLETFKPNSNKFVKMYVCGITPYDTTHLGHAFTYMFFDVLYRYLTYKKYKVIYTQNVTDINDRDQDILERARQQNISWKDLAQYWTKQFLQDMTALNWVMPTNYLKASEQIASMIRIIEALLKNGYAYQKEGNVFLDVTKVKDFGKLSKLTNEQMLIKAMEFEEDIDNKLKHNKLDVMLWRAETPKQPPHIPSFESPFSKGRPGWHIECSAMAINSLAPQIDIHGGGTDLIFPHHENEVAQSESATGKKPFAKYWLHTGVVKYKGQKMSKSLGNLILIKDLLKKYSPNAIRFTLLSHHYRLPWEYNESELETAQATLQKITKIIAGHSPSQIDSSNENLGVFESFMDDDINTPKALSYITTLTQSSVLYKTLSILGFIF